MRSNLGIIGGPGIICGPVQFILVPCVVAVVVAISHGSCFSFEFVTLDRIPLYTDLHIIMCYAMVKTLISLYKITSSPSPPMSVAVFI